MALLALALLGLSAFSAYFAWVNTRAMRAEQRRLALLASNTYTMILNHVFRSRKPKDWNDDRLKTQHRGENALTEFDWRKPGG